MQQRVLKNGVEIRDVADILGHSKTETTANYYISITEEKKQVKNLKKWSNQIL